MLSLAPVKYANIFASDGGPVYSIEESKLYLGDRHWAVANVRLIDRYRPQSSGHVLFAALDGTGLDLNPLHARYKAISEALERWALLEVRKREDRDRYGFAEDPTSNGMAAFPGFFSRQARKYALREAVERYALIAFWHGMLRLESASSGVYTGLTSYRIVQPFKHHEVAIVRRESKKGFTTFGYGAGERWEDAVQSAVLEMERSNILLELFYKRNPGIECGDLSTIVEFVERRLVYFSMPEGVECFEEKLQASQSVQIAPKKPEVLFDGEIKGPWSRYANVWRVAFKMPSRDFLDPDQMFFYW